MENLSSQIISLVKIIFFFCLACCLLPLLTLSSICVNITNKICLNCMNIIYPCYEFSNSRKIRTLIDTARNAGIFHFLIQINGQCDFKKITENYRNHLIEKKNKNGELRFPKLRQKLISCWGLYAWDRDNSKFDANNHIILSGRTYRGRVVNENNIQDFVSDLVTKYIPSDCPPWQVIVIPIISNASTSENDQQNQDESYYILVKLHHLLLAEEQDLHISELLMLHSDNSKNANVFNSYDNDKDDEISVIPKLSNFVESPKHIPNLWNQILMTTINRWNEFIYCYDPLESPDVDKKQQILCMTQLISIVFITVVTVFTDFTRGFNKTNNHIKYKIRYLWNLFCRESHKRNLTIQSVVDSLVYSSNPINIIRNIIKCVWYIAASAIILSPYYFVKELFAFKHILFTGHTEINGTFCGFISIYIPLIYCATRECLQIAIEIIKAPKNIFEELFLSKSHERNALQAKSFSGRKVVSFSKSIDLDKLRERLNLDELGETEYIFSCLGGSLKHYLNIFDCDYEIPKLLNATCRSISKEYFTDKYDKTDHIGGVVFLQLPLESSPKNQMKKIHTIFNRIRDKQIAIYLISMGQTKFDILTTIIPEVIMKIFINYFSYNFPITITELHGSGINKLKMNWGQSVKDLLFFRPPQSKTCLSLNIHRFGNKARLAVMADNQLAPEHTKISNNWAKLMEEVTISH